MGKKSPQYPYLTDAEVQAVIDSLPGYKRGWLMVRQALEEANRRQSPKGQAGHKGGRRSALVRAAQRRQEEQRAIWRGQRAKREKGSQEKGTEG